MMTVMTRAAERASRALLRDFNEVENLQVSEKGPGNFVTAADKRSEKIIYESLSQDRPDFGFLMEESGEIKGKDTARRWIIDPIDGTHNFMHGIPHWCISIALEEEGEVTAGLIVDPVRNEIFHAEKGGGAFTRGRRLRVSGRRELNKAIVATWFSYGDEFTNPDHKNPTAAIEHDLRKQCGDLRQMGSACLEYAYIAAGRMDGFIQGPLNPWDNAAGCIIVREAGGVFSDWQGRNEGAHLAQHLIVGNPDIHRALFTLTQQKKAA